jgi:hypothetical protein
MVMLFLFVLIGMSLITAGSAFATVFTVQIMDENDQPWEDIEVIIWVDDVMLGWVPYQGWTDGNGEYSTPNVAVDPNTNFWMCEVDDDPLNGYDGPDPNPDWDIPLSKVNLLMDCYEGWR